MTSKEIVLNGNQSRIFEKMKEFIRDSSARVFILKGHAGTGKTTMMKELIEELDRKNLLCSLLASTGRAAKILCNTTGRPANTVHSKIYKFADFNQDIDKMMQTKPSPQAFTSKNGQLRLEFIFTPLEDEERSEHYYIVDEASMIADKADPNPTQALFGTGRLLSDLLSYDSKGKYFFVGDLCQLPPVGQQYSPALSAPYLQQTFGLRAMEGELTEVVRQKHGNDLLESALLLRKLFAYPPVRNWGKFPLKGYRHIHLYTDQATLLQAYIKNIKEKGYNASTLLCRSNRICTTLTELVRPSLEKYQPTLQKGDLLLVTQNNYISGLMNGDMVEVVSLGAREYKAKLTFIHVEVKELFTERVYSQLLIEEVVYSTLVNLDQTQQYGLFLDFFFRMKEKGIRQKSDEFKQQMLRDPYLNALRAVYGYALTCHKAQGGEWEDVFADIPRVMARNPQAEVYQWLYTALTRARTHLHIVSDFYVEYAKYCF